MGKQLSRAQAFAVITIGLMIIGTGIFLYEQKIRAQEIKKTTRVIFTQDGVSRFVMKDGITIETGTLP